MRTKAIVAALGTSLLMVTAAPAQAAPINSDCIILGPHYVEEVVDCVFYILTRAIQ